MGTEAREPMVYMRVIEVRGERIVAICDEDLLGKRFEENGVVLHVAESFYRGMLVPLSIAMKEAKTATILNLVGESTINAAIREGLVHPEAVIRVKGVPHAQAVKIGY